MLWVRSNYSYIESTCRHTLRFIMLHFCSGCFCPNDTVKVLLNEECLHNIGDCPMLLFYL